MGENCTWGRINANGCSAKTVTLDYHKEWKVDVRTGEVTHRS